MRVIKDAVSARKRAWEFNVVISILLVCPSASIVKATCDSELCSESTSIFEPAFKRQVLLSGEGGVKMLDRHLGRGNEDRLGVGQRVEAVFSVVVPHPGRAGATERHGLDEQVNVYQVDAAAAEGQFADEPVDGFLVAAKDEAGERVRGRRHPCHRLVEGLVRQNR